MWVSQGVGRREQCGTSVCKGYTQTPTVYLLHKMLKILQYFSKVTSVGGTISHPPVLE